MNLKRVLRLMKKEVIQTRRDKRVLPMIFIASALQLFLFGYAVSTDVNHIATAVIDEDRTAASRALVDQFIRSGYFDYRYYAQRPEEVDRLLQAGRAQLVLRIPRGFSEDLSRGRTAHLQAILDGSDSMTAGIISGYAQGVVRQYSESIMLERLDRVRSRAPRIPIVEGRLRIWYNPELRSVNFMVPGVLCLILLIVTMLLTSLAIVKEKEIGTMEQLIVTPLTPRELMLGKTLPFLALGLADMTLVLVVALAWFGVRMAGSALLLYALTTLFLLTSLGLGIFISTISRTQQEAMMSGFFIMLPSVLLSGFMFPIENMPRVIQYVTYLIPMRYFLEIIRGIFLRGSGLEVLWPQALALAVFGVGILWLSAKRFTKRLG